MYCSATYGLDYVDLVGCSSAKGVYNRNTVGVVGDFQAPYAKISRKR